VAFRRPFITALAQNMSVTAYPNAAQHVGLALIRVRCGPKLITINSLK
jgi:hypothetical protein